METSNIDINSIITDTINTLFADLFASIDNSIYALLDDITFIDTGIISDNIFKSILGLSSSDGVLIVANALLFGMLLYYAISRLIAYFTGAEVQHSRSFIFRIIIYNKIRHLINFIIFTNHIHG